MTSHVQYRRDRRCGLLAASAACALSSLASAAQYTIVDLGTVGGPTSGAYAINDFGRVGGNSTKPDANLHGLFWNGGVTDVKPLGGDKQTHVFGINNQDLVIAMSYDLGELNVHGFVWQNQVSTPLGDFAPRGLNDAGTIVGYATVYDPTFGWVDKAARFVGGSLIQMGTLGGHFSYAYGISADGRIVGCSTLANDTGPHAFLWQGGTFHDLGTLGGTVSQAYAMNSAGDVVGWSKLASGAPRAALFTTDAGGNVLTRTNLGSLGTSSYAYAINSQRQIVGVSAAKAFLWQDGVMQDLNTLIPAGSNWQLDAAWAINEHGQIVGVGRLLGFPRAFLLEPAVPTCPDLNGDNAVDLTDLAILLSNFGLPSGATRAQGDLDGDGAVTLTDLATLLSAFGSPC